jgi:CheY-like chemotaxis protein
MSASFDIAARALDGLVPVRDDLLLRAKLPSETSQQPTTPSKNRRVLLVDDEERVISSLCRLFRREGYELVVATSGPDALRLLAASPVQLVISDHRMPGMTGIELLREIRARWPDTVRIILSGYSDVSTIIAAVNEGEIYKFITKPWNDEEIRLHVRRAIEQHELQKDNQRLAREIEVQNDRLRELNAILEQLAEDASAGLNSTQALLEAVGVGVFTVDRTGLVVTANRRANAILSSESLDLIGISAQVALPKVLCELVHVAEDAHGGDCTGRFSLDGRKLQCRVSPLDPADGRRGSIVALWEEVA